MSNIICDKCGSGDVREYHKPQKKAPQKVYKMSDVAEGKRPGQMSVTMNAVFTYSPMIVECQILASI